MIICNARHAENNINPENIFYVYDDNNVPIGKATTKTYENYTEFDSFPTNFFFKIHKNTVNDEARSMLLGAVLAQGYSYSAKNPNYSTKIYTEVSPYDTALINFYQNSGLITKELEEDILLHPPVSPKFRPQENNCTVEEIKLNNIDDITQICNRMNRYMINHLSNEKIMKLISSRLPVKALAIKHDVNIISEVLFYVRSLEQDAMQHPETTRSDKEAVIIGIYTLPKYRKYGVATSLLSKVNKYLNSKNIFCLRMRLQRRSIAQKGLARACNAKHLQIQQLCPSINELKENRGPANQYFPIPEENTNMHNHTQNNLEPQIQQVPQVEMPNYDDAVTDWNSLYQKAYPKRRGNQ